MKRAAGRTVGVALALACAGSAGAQTPHRSGLWAEIASGPGAVRIGCTGCSGVKTAGGAGGLLRLGGTISRKVMLGVEFYGFSDETFQLTADDPLTVASNGSVVATVLWYPWRGGVFLRGGVGIAAGTFTVEADSNEALQPEGTGVALAFGLGFDKAISRRFAVTVNAAAYITAIGDVTITGTLLDDVIAEMYQVSIGLTVR